MSIEGRVILSEVEGVRWAHTRASTSIRPCFRASQRGYIQCSFVTNKTKKSVSFCVIIKHHITLRFLLKAGKTKGVIQTLNWYSIASIAALEHYIRVRLFLLRYF